jgi:hypothetical protein
MLLLLRRLILVPDLARAVSFSAALPPHLNATAAIGGLQQIPGAVLSISQSTAADSMASGGRGSCLPPWK